MRWEGRATYLPVSTRSFCLCSGSLMATQSPKAPTRPHLSGSGSQNWLDLSVAPPPQHTHTFVTPPNPNPNLPGSPGPPRGRRAPVQSWLRNNAQTGLLRAPAAQLLLSLTLRSGSSAPSSPPTPRQSPPSPLQQQLPAEEAGEGPISAGDAAPAQGPSLTAAPEAPPPSPAPRLLPQPRPPPYLPGRQRRLPRAPGDAPSGLQPTAVMDLAAWRGAKAQADAGAPGTETPTPGCGGKRDGASLPAKTPALRSLRLGARWERGSLSLRQATGVLPAGAISAQALYGYIVLLASGSPRLDLSWPLPEQFPPGGHGRARP